MSTDGQQGPDRPATPSGEPDSGVPEGTQTANLAWSVVSYLVGGMLVWGGVGWLLDRWLGTSALFPIGVLLGVGVGLYVVVVRIYRS